MSPPTVHVDLAHVGDRDWIARIRHLDLDVTGRSQAEVRRTVRDVVERLDGIHDAQYIRTQV